MSPSPKKTTSRYRPAKGRASPSTEENTLYETPALGVFVTRGGEIRRAALAQESVRPLEALAADLGELRKGKRGLAVGGIPVGVLADTVPGGDLAGSLGISKD